MTSTPLRGEKNEDMGKNQPSVAGHGNMKL
jgi:hypothetical protein